MECGNKYAEHELCEMSQVRRKSTGNKGNTTQVPQKDLDSDTVGEKKSTDKQAASAKSTKSTGVPQGVS